MFAEVIVDIIHYEVDKIFEYSFSDCNVQLGSRVLVPFGAKYVEGIVIKINDESNYPIEKIKPVYKVLEETPALTKESISLMEYVTKSCYVTKASALRLFLPSEMRKGRIKEKFTLFAELKENIDVDKVISALKSSAKKQRDCILFLGENGKTELSFLNKEFGSSAVKSLKDKEIISVITEQTFRSPYKNLGNTGKQVVLTNNQLSAIDSIVNTDKEITLLHGVTGSGKTEIYLNLIDRAIKDGKSAIMLVPEISLTPQMLAQLRARFSENVSILHSGLSAGERFDEWWRIRNKEANIVIGARSAIFAPIENIGIIIIDEEHDGSYISESSPRYNTIDVASFRAKYNGGKIVLGSATPSVESYLLAKNGEYNLVELKDRINKKPLPEVEIADMRNEVRRGNNSPFSSVLKSELSDCLNKGNQAILFLNQRGYSRTVICTECGHVQKCSDCDVSLTYHYEDNSLLCHYCGAKYKMIDKCTNCGSKYLKYGGIGTEKIVLELHKLFPQAKILRMDRDTTQSKEGHFSILSAFARHEADILVGTQMIAKGHDFPSVTLVGILDADMSLHFADYRSAERTFQLITQVAGRSGRADETGKVVLQTYQPDNLVLKRAIQYDYEGFYKEEIAIRKATAFPPYTDIVRILISSESEDDALIVTKAVYQELSFVHETYRDKFRFFGCMKAPIKKLQNKYRFQVLMRINAKDKDLTDKIFITVNKYKSSHVNVVMEINSNNLS